MIYNELGTWTLQTTLLSGEVIDIIVLKEHLSIIILGSFSTEKALVIEVRLT